MPGAGGNPPEIGGGGGISPFKIGQPLLHSSEAGSELE
jgi:hypothetical protein